MRKYILNSKWGILSLPILPRLLFSPIKTESQILAGYWLALP